MALQYIEGPRQHCYSSVCSLFPAFVFVYLSVSCLPALSIPSARVCVSAQICTSCKLHMLLKLAFVIILQIRISKTVQVHKCPPHKLHIMKYEQWCQLYRKPQPRENSQCCTSLYISYRTIGHRSHVTRIETFNINYLLPLRLGSETSFVQQRSCQVGSSFAKL